MHISSQNPLLRDPLLHPLLVDEIIGISAEEVSKSKFDTKEFQRGINDVSRVCGMITALVNVGITPSMALSYISENESNKSIIDSNYKIAELQSKTAKDTAKYNYEVSQKNII